MSIAAIQWAWMLEIGHSSAKLVLLYKCPIQTQKTPHRAGCGVKIGASTVEIEPSTIGGFINDC